VVRAPDLNERGGRVGRTGTASEVVAIVAG
jgi:hypothetical protein